MKRVMVSLLLLAACSDDPSLVGADAAVDGWTRLPDATPLPDGPDAAPMGRFHVRKEGEGSFETGGVAPPCGAGCSEQTFTAYGIRLTLMPAPGWSFAGWDGPSCSASGAADGYTCFLYGTPDGVRELTVRFVRIEHNLVFVTSSTTSGGFGGAAGGDRICRDAASAAGLSGTYVAFVDTSAGPAESRLRVPRTTRPARGWTRPDGVPVFDSVDDITAGRIIAPIALDETSRLARLLGDQPWVGSAGATCDDWSNVFARGSYGDAKRGPVAWRQRQGDVFGGECEETRPLYCFGVDREVALPARVASGKRLWVTREALAPPAGLEGAAALCAAERPPGVTRAVPLLSTLSTAASTHIDPDATYVRPDGLRLGRGQDLLRVTEVYNEWPLAAGVWAYADGALATEDTAVFTGSSRIDERGTAGGTCSDWQSPGGRDAFLGIFHNQIWWSNRSVSADGQCTPHPIYCIEE